MGVIVQRNAAYLMKIAPSWSHAGDLTVLSAVVKVQELKMCSTLRGSKGLGHAILGNFSTDRMVIELVKISK